MISDLQSVATLTPWEESCENLTQKQHDTLSKIHQDRYLGW